MHLNLYKILISASILLSTINPASAWDKVATNLTMDGDFYISSSSIRKEGSRRFVWELINHPAGSREGYQSVKVQNEYDCSNNRFRLTYATIHTEYFAKGSTKLMISSPQQWNQITKGSIGDIVKAYVCNN